MFEFLTDWFSDIDWNIAVWALLIWSGIAIVMFKMLMANNYYKLYLKIIIVVVMLPITYFIVWKMSDN